MKEVINAISRAISKNDQIFWVCPLVKDSEKLDLAAAETRAKYLENYFPKKVALVHGQMSSEEKETALSEFSSQNKPILVATTVIEVGIDIPNATIMIIEHAERFGLAQLHQLRGRVGRGTKESICILLYSSNIGNIAKERLSVMRETNDGFIKVLQVNLTFKCALNVSDVAYVVFQLMNNDFLDDQYICKFFSVENMT